MAGLSRFRLDGHPVGDRYTTRVINWPGGQTQAPLALPPLPGGPSVAVLTPTDSPEEAGTRLAQSRLLGAGLFRALFADDILTTFRRSLDEASQSSKGLRIKLRLNDVPELQSIPWELLYDPAPANRFLTQSRLTPVVRFLELPSSFCPCEFSHR